MNGIHFHRKATLKTQMKESHPSSQWNQPYYQWWIPSVVLGRKNVNKKIIHFAVIEWLGAISDQLQWFVIWRKVFVFLWRHLQKWVAITIWFFWMIGSEDRVTISEDAHDLTLSKNHSSISLSKKFATIWLIFMISSSSNTYLCSIFSFLF